MFRNVTPEKTIEFTRISVALSCFLPLSSKASKLQVICYKILRFVMLLNALCFFPPLVNALFTYNDPLNVSQSVCFLTGEFQTFSNMIIRVVHHDRLRELMEVMQVCFKNANVRENLVFQRYVDRFSTFYGMSTLWVYVTGTVTVLATLVTPDPFPTNAVYPFPVDYEPLKTLIFLLQTFTILAYVANACVNVLCALLLLFAAARFQILYMELCEVKNSNELISCMKKYYILKRYANEVVSAVQFVALFTVIQTGVAIVVCGITLIQPQPFTVKVQYLFVVGTALMEVFMCARPADHLLDLSENVMQGIYESRWYDQSVSMQKAVSIVLSPQDPVAIKIPCIVPTLSLNYFCSFVTNVFSLFSVLRVAITKDV